MWCSCFFGSFRRAVLAIGGLLLSTVFAGPAFAQQHLVDRYSLEEGLPQSQVNDVVQGPRGFLWLGLYGGGVARFDGQAFETITMEEGLPNNKVVSLHFSPSGVLWVGTRGGLARYDGTDVQAFTTDNSTLPSNNVLAIAGGADGSLWFGTPEGVVTYGDSTLQRLAPDRLQSISDGSLAATGDTLWIGTSEGLYRYADSAMTAIPLPEAVSENASVTMLAAGTNGRLWVETNEGLFRYREGTFERLAGTANLDVIAVRDAPVGPLWIGTRDGLYRRVEGQLQRFPGDLGDEPVECIFGDREQNVWFGTNGRGLFKYTRTPFDRFTTGNGLAGQLVWDIVEGPDGDLWIATRDGLSRYDGRSFTDVPGPTGRLRQAIHALYWTQEGHLWISTRSTLFVYDGATYRSYERAAGDALGFVTDIAGTPSGTLWFATLGSGVLRYDGSGFTRYTTEEGLVSNETRYVTTDEEGRVWAGKGVSRFEGGRFQPTEAVVQSEIESISDLTVGPDGALWLGTGQGVYALSGSGPSASDSLVAFTPEEGLSGTISVFLLFDRSGHLWTGTEEGVNRLDVGTYRRTGTMPIRSYSRKDGLFTGQAAARAALRGEKGRLWFGTTDGLVRYNPAEEHPRPGPPRPYVTDVELFAESGDWARYSEGFTPWERLPVSLTLPPDKTHLTFHYAGLSYTAPDRVRYRYRLRGFDDRWSKPVQRRQATYSNLPPGAYTFQVKASKGDGRWSSRTATYTFTVERPFWQTTWFYVLCGLGGLGLLGGLFVGAVRWRTRRLEAENRRLKTQFEQWKQAQAEWGDE